MEIGPRTKKGRPVLVHIAGWLLVLVAISASIDGYRRGRGN